MQADQKDVVVIGGGAAGFFAAIKCKEQFPDYSVCILEASQKVLSKVKVSGGGRCNVTTSISAVNDLIQHYPRGGKKLKQLFHQFGPKEMVNWLEQRGVTLKTEDDGRMFPMTDDSQTIINCFTQEVRKFGISVRKGAKAQALAPNENGWLITGVGWTVQATNVILTTGGVLNSTLLESINQPLVKSVPSLFSFNIKDQNLTTLTGLKSEHAQCSIQGTKIKSSGPLLITHWGMSGPAILKLSSQGARALNDCNYQFKLRVNWVGRSELDVRSQLGDLDGKKQLKNSPQWGLSQRLWQFLLERSSLRSDIICNEVGSKGWNKLVETLTNDVYEVAGKTTFKEEFVTCGGVDLAGIELKTMESKINPRLFFAGEVLDIDGVTGGFNFQAAWTTAYVAGSLGCES